MAHDSLEKSLKEKLQKISLLEEVIRFLKYQKFGRSSEKFTGPQSDLFNEAEELVELELLDDAIEEVAPASKPAKKKPNLVLWISYQMTLLGMRCSMI